MRCKVQSTKNIAVPRNLPAPRMQVRKYDSTFLFFLLLMAPALGFFQLSRGVRPKPEPAPRKINGNGALRRVFSLTKFRNAPSVPTRKDGTSDVMARFVPPRQGLRSRPVQLLFLVRRCPVGIRPNPNRLRPSPPIIKWTPEPCSWHPGS